MQTGLKTRLCLAALGLVAVFTFLSTHLVTLQAVEHEDWLKRAEADYARKRVLPCQRGAIFDRHGEQLAHNRPVFELVADRYRFEDCNTVINGLAKARGTTPRVISKEAGGRGQPEVEKLLPAYRAHAARVLADHIPGGEEAILELLTFDRSKRRVLARGLTPEMRQEITGALRAAEIRGIDFEEGTVRFYPAGEALCHVLGFTNHAGVGQEGVEATMNTWMEGEDGFREIMVDRHGREIPSYRGATRKPRDGADVHLTIDVGLQTIVEEELELGWRATGAERMGVVLMDPRSGDILAMASRPHFDPNSRRGCRSNFSFSSAVEPGSTFKLVAVAAALDRGVVSLETQIDCENGRLVEGKLTVPDWTAFGTLTVAEIIARSSNIGAYKLARRVGMRGYYDYVTRFGFGQRTGVRLTAESGGFVRQEGVPSDFSRCAYGYAVSVTPLQLACAYGTVANHGVRMKPRLVTRVTGREGRVLWDNPTEIRERVLKPSTASQVTRALRRVVEHERGTGKDARVPGYTVAGKTGTATRYDEDCGRYVQGTYVCSFAGFVPADQPRLVCVVVADRPTTTEVNHYGGMIAGPVFSRICARAMARLDVPPDVPEELANVSFTR